MKRRKYTSLAEINITNLVDVTMVLLIVFMLTAPFLQSGVKINLPKAEAKVIEEKEGVTIAIDEEGEIYIENKLVPWNTFTAELRKALEATAPSRAPACSVPRPAPPYCSGTRIPMKPCSAKAR